MRRLTLLLVVLGAALAAGTAPAAAASQTVAVGDDFFAPSRVAVKPGESVTWNNPGSDEGHNVHFVDGSFTEPRVPGSGPWTAKNQFTSAGKYAYYCLQHGPMMSGVVYVNALGKLPPLVAVSVSANPAQTGQSVTFDASASSDSDGIAKYEWDLDGNGSFETNTGTTPTVAHSYPTPTSVNVKVRVTDNQGLSDVGSVSLQVNAPGPPKKPPTLVSPPPSTPMVDRTAPSVTGYAMTSRAFRTGKASTPNTGRATGKPAIGTTFQYKLSEAARVKIDLQRLLPGRKMGKTCVHPTATLSKARTCIRAIGQGTLARTSHVGANSVAFTGRVGNRTLKPGSYQAVLTATDAAGNTSARKTLMFKVLRP